MIEERTLTNQNEAQVLDNQFHRNVRFLVAAAGEYASSDGTDVWFDDPDLWLIVTYAALIGVLVGVICDFLI